MRKLVVIGAGGHAAELLWAAEEMGCWDIQGCVVYDPPRSASSVGAWPVLGTTAQYAERSSDIAFCCGIGDNAIREKETAIALKLGWEPVSLIHPSATLAASAAIEPGTYIAPGAVVSVNTKLGSHVIVNYLASIGHDSVVGGLSQICPGVRISGRCRIGRSVFVGSNTVLAPDTVVGDGVVIGACSFVRGSVPAGVRIAGVPAGPF